MPWTTHLLVVANRTAESAELLAYLRARAQAGPIDVTLAVPVEIGGRDAARRRLESALAAFREAGIRAHGTVTGDGDPLHAVLDAYDPARHDEIVFSTLPQHLSRWLGCALPERVRRMTGALVRHVESPSVLAATRR